MNRDIYLTKRSLAQEMKGHKIYYFQKILPPFQKEESITFSKSEN